MSARLRSAVLVLIALWTLVSCGPPPPDPAGAVAAVEAFVAALEDRDASAIIQLLEPSEWRGEIGPELRSYLGMMETLELRDPSYSVVEQRGDIAVVAVAGMFVYSFAETDGSGERPLDLRVETVLVDDQWYLRGLELPQP